MHVLSDWLTRFLYHVQAILSNTGIQWSFHIGHPWNIRIGWRAKMPGTVEFLIIRTPYLFVHVKNEIIILLFVQQKCKRDSNFHGQPTWKPVLQNVCYYYYTCIDLTFEDWIKAKIKFISHKIVNKLGNSKLECRSYHSCSLVFILQRTACDAWLRYTSSHDR